MANWRGVVSRQRRKSAQKHAGYGHTCPVCKKRVFGNGGWSSHKRKHVRAWLDGASLLELPKDVQNTLQVWIRKYMKTA